MQVIALLGTIQHEISNDQIKRLFSLISRDAGNNAITIANADGLFAKAANLSTQLDMLFDNGIQIVFAGNRAISRNASRKELSESRWPILRPINLPDCSAGKGAMLFKLSEDAYLWILSIALFDNKGSFEPENLAIEKFFHNKTDSFSVLINVHGKCLDSKAALAWKYSDLAPIIWYCTGSNWQTSVNEQNFFQADCGSVASTDTIAGINCEQWWKMNYERVSDNCCLSNGLIKADYSLLWLDDKAKVVKIEKRTVKI